MKIKRNRSKNKRIWLNLSPVDDPAMKAAYTVEINKFDALDLLQEECYSQPSRDHCGHSRDDRRQRMKEGESAVDL